MKSVLDILTGVPIETWGAAKFYERDEYVSYNGGFYRSVIDGNVGNQPDQTDKWVLEQISAGGSSIPKFRIKTVSSGYSTVNTDFDGRTLLRVESSNNANITVTKPASEDFVGLTLTIRKVSGDSSSLTINAGCCISVMVYMMHLVNYHKRLTYDYTADIDGGY